MSDLIKRQDAIWWVKTECNPYGKPTLDFESGKKVIEHLEHMPSADRPQEWIPCSERLPEVHEVVLVTFEYDGDMLVGITERSQGGFWISENVVAWQPLPQPWKGIDVDCFDSCEYAYSETCDECYKGNKYKRR